ncbi:MAG: hypothetical protein QOI74_2540 [Micromonosporaceae bacterium]|nr:hypothetical protein [Micromonosporaceae bacterium]
MRFEVLGSLRVRDSGSPVRVGGPREQKLLALLLLSGGHPVPYPRLAVALWGDAPPATGRAQIHNSVAALRRALGTPVRITRSASGFALDLAGHEFDAADFSRLTAEGARLADPYAAAERCQAALALWRGPALDGLGGAILAAEARRLEEDRLACLERRLTLDLQVGRHDEVAGELAALVDAHPWREKLVELRMRALYATGRQQEALAVYAVTRRLLAEELGLDPSPVLQRLQAAILGGEAVGTDGPGPAGVPRQLPACPRHFVGRRCERTMLDRLADSCRDRAGTVVSAITGMPGLGKSALAVHWAHQAAHRFPDGQLYVNLRGFDPAGPPIDPAEAIRWFLQAFAVPPERIPVHPDAQTALYRSLLAGRRALIVLDNARDEDQVRPLLPGGPSCLVVITSRRQLPSLVAMEGAHPITLNVFTRAEAEAFLRQRLGATVDDDAVGALIEHCARLPLALAIAASRVAVNPTLSLAAVDAELTDVRGRLDVLDTGHPTTNLRTVFSWSYRGLTAGARRLFRLLGLVAGADIGTSAVASLAGLPVASVRPLLAELVRAHLVNEHTPGRFAVHDLLRAYAADLARSTDAAENRYSAIQRVLDYYLHTAYAAAVVLDAHRDTVAPEPARPGVTPLRPADPDEAWEWFASESPVALAAVRQAAAQGYDPYCWQLAWHLAVFLDRKGHWHDWAVAQELALTAVRRLADRPGQARIHRGLAGAYLRLDREEDAHAQLAHALALFRELGDINGQACTHHNLASVFERQHRYAESLHHAWQAQDLFHATGQRGKHLRALNTVGWCHSRLGEYQRALTYCRQALTLQRQITDRRGEAATWDSLGYIHHHLGNHRTAISCYDHALGLLRELGSPYHEADTLVHIGDTYTALGDAGAARDAWQRSAAILDRLGHHPDVDEIRAKLAAFDRTRVPSGLTSEPATS